MSYCDNCLHIKVCGLENVGDEAMTYCCDKLAWSNDVISRQAALEKAINVPIAKVVTEDKVIYRKVIFADDIEKLPSVEATVKIKTVTNAKEAEAYPINENMTKGFEGFTFVDTTESEDT